MRKVFSAIVASTVLAAGLTACGSDSGSSDEVEIGILIPQSGDAAVTGRFMTDGAMAAVEEINAAGGINGKKIDAKIYDTVGDPQNGINAYKKFTSDGGKFAIVGFSAVVTAIGPLASREDVLLVNSGAPPFDAEAMGSHTIHTLNGQDHEMQCAADYAYDTMGTRKLGAIFADIAANRAGVESLSKDFEEKGGEVVGAESAPQGSSDFRSVLTRLKRTNPDTVYVYTYGSDPGNILKQMKELDFDAKTLMYSGAAVPQTIEVGGAAAEKSLYTAGLFDPSNTDPQTAAFLEAYKKVDPDSDPSSLGFYNATLYDGVKMLAKAMEYVDDHGGDMNDPRTVEKAFYEVKTFEAATGTATYEEGDPIARKPFQVLEVQGGKFLPIDTVEC
ncbi:ABC transporter substrate-binding protein [Nocardioides sp. LHD-245]|uniref:ABC transporter substrate-binding protein n=1 Tax=Nocardioides sp. LHD-245 TaxID=3051387 RepID=UPI0027E164F3|nr:ABC transporter substrate-binding protein [Nocardioides sp. LHD-245]